MTHPKEAETAASCFVEPLGPFALLLASFCRFWRHLDRINRS